MTMFGRDSIFTSLQALPVHARARGHDAAGARRLAGQPRRRLPRRGSRPDPPRDALRRDGGVRGAPALALLRLAPTRRRCTSCCSTSTSAGPATASSSATSSTRRGRRSNWIDEYADLMGNGYISYKRRNEETGLENQCWKDSWNSISYRDGRLPGFPRATCELQGYAYDAKVRGARLARLVWKDPAFADRLEQAGGRPQAALQPRLLGRGRRVLRARARRRRQPGRLARVEQRPPALERHRRQVEGEGGRSAT